MTVLYTPLDIKVEPFDEQRLIDWFDENKIDEPDYWVFKEGRHEWALAAASQPVENWQRIKPYEDWLAQGHQQSPDAKLEFAPGFATQFPGLVKAIRQLPFIEIGAVGLLKQLKAIEPHVDTFDPTDPIEPRRYMMYLTAPNENTFYVQQDGTNVNVPINPEYRAFAFNSTDTKHGADFPVGTKILMSIVGILDQEKHEELIAKSLTKFPDWVILDQSY